MKFFSYTYMLTEGAYMDCFADLHNLQQGVSIDAMMNEVRLVISAGGLVTLTVADLSDADYLGVMQLVTDIWAYNNDMQAV